jgi:hypothetical protein
VIARVVEPNFELGQLERTFAGIPGEPSMTLPRAGLDRKSVV